MDHENFMQQGLPVNEFSQTAPNFTPTFCSAEEFSFHRNPKQEAHAAMEIEELHHLTGFQRNTPLPLMQEIVNEPNLFHLPNLPFPYQDQTQNSQSFLAALGFLGDISSNAQSGFDSNPVNFDPLFHLNLPPPQPPLFSGLMFESQIPNGGYSMSTGLFLGEGSGGGYGFDNGVFEFNGGDRSCSDKKSNWKCSNQQLSTDKERREQLSDKYKVLGSLAPKPSKDKKTKEMIFSPMERDCHILDYASTVVLQQQARPTFGFGVTIVTSTSDALSSLSQSPCLHLTFPLRNSRTSSCTCYTIKCKVGYLCLRFSTISVWMRTTKPDRASVLGDAIGYIKELVGTVNKLKMMVEMKRCRRERIKRPKTENDGSDYQEQSYNGSRSSWVQRKHKDNETDVRIVDDEVTIKFAYPQKKINCLLPVSKALDELQLDIQHVGGGLVGDNYCFLFNSKICEGYSVYASTIANKIIDVLDK